MIHHSEYAKKLLQKILEGTASPLESARWAAARHIYTDEEIARMTAQLLEDVKETVTAAQISRHSAILNDILTRSFNKPSIFVTCTNWLIRNGAMAVVTVATLLSAYLLAVHKINDRGAGLVCPGMMSDRNIPTAAFFCNLALGKDTSLIIDSNSRGTIARVGNIVVMQMEAGMIEFRSVSNARETDTGEHASIQVTTGPGQQYRFTLPDGTRIRLNASSYIRLPASANAYSQALIEIAGEAYVEAAADTETSVIIKTGNAVINANSAAFNIQTGTRFTSAALMKGELQLKDTTGRSIMIERPGDKGFLMAFRKSEEVTNDTFLLVRPRNMDSELMWMKTTRVYTRTSLRKFAADMSRWYGFTIKNLNCIPKDIRVSTSICYQAPLQDVFAIFRKAGVTVYENKGTISFCDPAPNKTHKGEKRFVAYVAR